MRIYIAGFFMSHGVGTLFSQTSNASQPAWVLESYHYMNDKKVAEIASRGYTVFMDSGAFSMFTQGVTVDLKEYAEYLDKHQDIIHVASSLDCIGRGREQDSYDNLKTLEKYGAKVQPVHHARDKDEWLLRYLDEGYDYLFLGGMVPESTEYLRTWLDRIFSRYLMNPDGTAKIKVHGFGLTTIELMTRYPWYSVDSTSWVMTSRFGGIYYDYVGSPEVRKIALSSKSPKLKEAGAHFNTLSPHEQKEVLARIEELGFKIDDLRDNYGFRDRWNIEFFKRFQERPCDTAWRKQQTFF